jgi:hypothetical protein
MKVLLGVVLAVALAVLPLSTQNASAADTNNFKISLFDVQYDLSRDENNRSVLKTTETIVAEFPNFDQNHGIERALPSKFDGHSTNLKIQSITDSSGMPREYSTDTENDMSVLRIGDPDKYAYGTQTYVLTYTQNDVARYFADSGLDEWYWDTNGTQWKVPIDSLAITYKINDDLVNARVGMPACYRGASGAKGSCSTNEVGDVTYTVRASNLGIGENITVATGFNKGTFAAYEQTFAEKLTSIWQAVFFITLILGFAGLIALSVIYSRRMNRLSELSIIVTEYIPPKGTSVLVSSKVISVVGSAFAAQLIDFAVRHYIEVIETQEKSLWKSAQYDIKVISDPQTLLEEEKEILSDMFGSLPKVGDRVSLKSLTNNMAYYLRTADNDKKLTKLVEQTYALRKKSPKASKFFYRWAFVHLIVGILTLSPALLLIAGMIALQGKSIRPLTDKGLDLRRYLLGLTKYIKAAEAERLKFLQGPDTAQKVGESVDINNPGQLVKLYERVLPYAILFGLEKEWSKRLGEFYESTQTRPDWYSGNAAFNAVIFSSALSNFSTAASYSGGSASSSSSGASGGGSSGGGGGGGGGGGW